MRDSNRPPTSTPEQLSDVSEEIGPRSKVPVPDMQVVPNGWGKWRGKRVPVEQLEKEDRDQREHA